MSVVENDNVVRGMLQDELMRCEGILKSLNEAFSEMPKGSLSSRYKRYKNKRYSYFCLKYRIGKKVYCKHISNADADGLKELLMKRSKYESEIKSYNNRIRYLKRLLSIGGKK